MQKEKDRRPEWMRLIYVSGVLSAYILRKTEFHVHSIIKPLFIASRPHSPRWTAIPGGSPCMSLALLAPAAFPGYCDLLLLILSVSLLKYVY